MLRLLIIVVCAAPGLAAAGSLRVGADFGYTRHTRGGDLNGLGGDLFVGRAFASGLVLEGQLGVHHNWHEGDTGYDFDGSPADTTRLELTSIPILIGGRYEFDVGAFMVPFAGAHAGVAVVRSSGALGNLTSQPEVAVDFAFNLGAGVDFAVGENWGLGFGVWYSMVLAGETERVAGVDVTRQHDGLVTLALNLRFDL